MEPRATTPPDRRAHPGPHPAPNAAPRGGLPVRSRLGAATAFAGLLSAAAVRGATPGFAATGPARTRTVPVTVPPRPGGGGAYVAAVTRIGPRIIDLSVDSPAMGAKVPVRVILPSGWSPRSARTYPTLYLLQGASDDYTSWTRETDVAALASKAQVIVVMPDGGRAGFYTNWWNYGRQGDPRWETFHTAELPRIMESGYRAGTRRAVIGLSEGGLGALAYAARHSGAYVFAGSFSGPVDLDDTLLRDGIVLTCLREGVDPLRLWGDPKQNRAVWDLHNPARLVPRFRGIKVHLSAAMGRTGPLDVNSPPEAGLLEVPAYLPNLRLADALRKDAVDVTAHLYEVGTHTWPYWQRELHVAWPAVLAALQAAG